MALINSIALGKVGGKLGNVIFQSYMGDVVARQLNTHMSVPPTSAQVAQRNKFGAAGAAYSYLASFLGDAVGIIKGSETMSAAFTRIVAPALNGISIGTPLECADAMLGRVYGVSNFVSIYEFNISTSVPTVRFRKIYGDFDSGIYVNMLAFNSVTGAYYHQWRELTEQEYNDGVFLFPDEWPSFDGQMCYIALPKHQMCSEIYCQHN